MRYMGVGAIIGSSLPALWGVGDWHYAVGVVSGVAFQWMSQGKGVRDAHHEEKG